MGYRAITNKGIIFIRNRCKSAGDRFKGSLKYPLGRSNLGANTYITANVYDDNNKKIISADVLADHIIYWVEKYCSMYQLDSNIIAAQIYAESGYDLWRFSNGGKNGSSAMGISQFIDTAVYDIIIKNTKDFSAEHPKITNGLNGNVKSITTIIPYYSTKDRLIESTRETDDIAIGNRSILFQNIIDNPEILIKAQCHLMSQIGQRNNNLAASSLFAYNRGAYLTSKSYNEIITNAVKKNITTDEGIKYVDKIFKVLAGTYGNGIPKDENFGSPYTEMNQQVDADANKNLTNSILLSNQQADLKNKNENGEYALYDNGSLIRYGKIEKIADVNVLIEYKDKIFEMINAAKLDNITLVLESGFRSFDEQVFLRKKNILDKSKINDINYILTARSSAFSPETSKPVYSNHQDGIAYDFSITNKPEIYDWMILNAFKYGFIRTVPSERWHWEYKPLETNPFKFVAYTHETWDGKSDILKSQLS